MTAESIKRGKQRNQIIRKEKAVELAAKGELTQQEAGAICGYTNQRISQLVQEYKSNPDTILFIANKDKVLESLQAKIVNSVGDDDLKKASLSQKVLATAVLNDKIQLLRGEATSIAAVDIRHLIAIIGSTATTSSDTSKNKDNDNNNIE
jgi:hypothetical protein